MSWQGFVPPPQNAGDRKSKGKKSSVASRIAAFNNADKQQQQSSNRGPALSANKKKSWNTHNQMDPIRPTATSGWKPAGNPVPPSSTFPSNNFSKPTPVPPSNNFSRSNNFNQSQPAPVNNFSNSNSFNKPAAAPVPPSSNNFSSGFNSQPKPQPVNNFSNSFGNYNKPAHVQTAPAAVATPWNTNATTGNSWNNNANAGNSWNNNNANAGNSWNNNLQFAKVDNGNQNVGKKQRKLPMKKLGGLLAVGFAVVLLVIVIAVATSGNNNAPGSQVNVPPTPSPTNPPVPAPTNPPVPAPTNPPVPAPTNPPSNPPVQVQLFPAETRRGNNLVGLFVLNSLDSASENAFISAADRWSNIIAGTGFGSRTFTAGQNVCSEGAPFQSTVTINHLIIFAQVVPIDGAGNVLGSAGPCFTVGGFPILGQMKFDNVDIGGLIQRGTLESVILHEMGHVLGIGTLFGNLLIDRVFDGNTINRGNLPKFLGTRARLEMGRLRNPNNVVSEPFVPVEDGFFNGVETPFNINAGQGRGSIDGHWDEDEFLGELMEFRSRNDARLSIVTVGALQDMGYTVSFNFVDSYTLFSQQRRRPDGIQDEGEILYGDILDNDIIIDE